MLHEFSYLVPRKCEELYKILREKGNNAKILAGGTDLLVSLRMGETAPVLVVDIKKIPELHRISWSENEGLSIGAAVTVVELMEHKTVKQKYPLLADAGGRLGSPQLRNRATVGGNLCTASPCADMGAGLLALGASVEVGSWQGKRSIKLKDFFIGVKRTDLKPHEILLRIMVPAESANARSGMEKLKRIKGHDMALVSVAMMKNADVIRFAIGSSAPTPIVLKDFPANAVAKEVVTEALRSVSPITDVRGAREFRIFMVQAMIEKLMDRVN